MRSHKGLTVVLVLAALSAVPAAAQPADGTLRVGAVKYKSAGDFTATYEPLMEFLAAELGLEPIFVQVPDARLAHELKVGEHDLGVFTPFPYLKARLDFAELEVFASHVVRSSRTYSGAILARADGPITSLAALRGRRVLFVKETSTSGYKVPKGILREHDIDVENDLEVAGFSGGHDVSLRALLMGEVEAVAVDQAALSELAPAERSRLRILEEYEIPYHAYVLAPGIEAAWADRIRQAMFEAHKNPVAEAAFQNPLGIERWEPRADDSYNPLRRWLGIVRVKPSLTVSIHTKSSARKALESRGDLAELMIDKLVARLRASRRFERVTAGEEGSARKLHIDLSVVDEEYHCQVYLDEDRRIASFDLAAATLQEQLPEAVASQALAALELVDRLRHNGEEYFITYGRNDGLEADDYAFTLTGDEGERVELPVDAVSRISSGNAFFREIEGLAAGRVVEARYRARDLVETHEVAQHEDHDGEGLFAFIKANLLEVISLTAGLVSVLVGGYIARRRKHRFRTVLAEFTQLLKDHIEDKYNLDNRLYEQRERIASYLDRGYITDSQFVILQRRLEEIHEVLRRLYAEGAKLPGDLKSEVQSILQEGKVPEREYNRLLALLRKREGSPPAAPSN